ncbi:hypothetical protein RRG08_046044 [Elysia crispata]|uniref:Uncharacterized protein n=1 Tax=Elysia crispata TaxID=231223 RepID=A0AAE1DK42_9GAST|nr:hypothetical protein RRG08_046044 [Elysia crispata]
MFCSSSCTGRLLNLAEILASRRQLLCSGPISTRSSQLSSLQSSIRFDPPALWMAGRESKLQAPLVMLMITSLFHFHLPIHDQLDHSLWDSVIRIDRFCVLVGYPD